MSSILGLLQASPLFGSPTWQYTIYFPIFFQFKRAHHSKWVHSLHRVRGRGLLGDVGEGGPADGLSPLDLERGGRLLPRILSVLGVLHPTYLGFNSWRAPLVSLTKRAGLCRATTQLQLLWLVPYLCSPDMVLDNLFQRNYLKQELSILYTCPVIFVTLKVKCRQCVSYYSAFTC